MTELLDEAVAVRTAAGGTVVVAVRRPSHPWRQVSRTTNRWRVETDWWSAPIRRDYRRCLLDDGECVEVHQNLETGSWHAGRRYD